MTKQELIEKYEYELKLLRLQFGEILRTKVYEELLDYLKQLDEPQKVTIPQFVADWIEYCKRRNFTLFECLDPVDNFEVLVGEDFEGDARKCIVWCRSASDKAARAWLDGYEIEKEKRYTIRFKNIRRETRYLKYDRVVKDWYFGVKQYSKETKIYHTRKELEEAGFGEVFNSPLFEVEEVE
ncbi:DUF1642 domain-containing protein [Streptococcus rubneri]|uniref:DUF1642 domain-containing protein n=1 Tax=Streptococcus rubneri TaxID=1234680 RepID=UPI00189FDACE|nr:DUF1642 domain-containing protein [Streptococcus rubneri]